MYRRASIRTFFFNTGAKLSEFFIHDTDPLLPEQLRSHSQHLFLRSRRQAASPKRVLYILPVRDRFSPEYQALFMRCRNLSISGANINQHRLFETKRCLGFRVTYNSTSSSAFTISKVFSAPSAPIIFAPSVGISTKYHDFTRDPPATPVASSRASSMF